MIEFGAKNMNFNDKQKASFIKYACEMFDLKTKILDKKLYLKEGEEISNFLANSLSFLD